MSWVIMIEISARAIGTSITHATAVPCDRPSRLGRVGRVSEGAGKVVICGLGAGAAVDTVASDGTVKGVAFPSKARDKNTDTILSFPTI
jgi:hypothetical protein